MNQQTADEWLKRKELEEEDGGFEPKPWNGVAIHSGNTEKHEFCKWALCYALEDLSREWDTEVECDTGRVDVYDAGPSDGAALIYEVETDLTPKQRKKKAEQYSIGPIRDVIVIDPADVPDDPGDAVEYMKNREIVGGS